MCYFLLQVSAAKSRLDSSDVAEEETDAGVHSPNSDCLIKVGIGLANSHEYAWYVKDTKDLFPRLSKNYTCMLCDYIPVPQVLKYSEEDLTQLLEEARERGRERNKENVSTLP